MYNSLFFTSLQRFSQFGKAVGWRLMVAQAKKGSIAQRGARDRDGSPESENGDLKLL